MGTSGSSKGPGSNTPLVPTWLDQPIGGSTTSPSDGPQTAATNADNQNNVPSGSQPAIPLPTISNRYRSARGNLTSYARSGGNNTHAMRRAVRDYVRTGSRGSANATKKMGSARATASSAIGILQSFQNNGVSQTLSDYNLSHLQGRSIDDVFIGLTDIVCKDGGSIDEGIARDSWLESIIQLGEAGINDLDQLTNDPSKIQDFLINFISISIERKIIQEIGSKSLKVSKDLQTLERIERQLTDYIKGAVKDSFSSNGMNNLSSMSEQDIKAVVDNTYNDTWDLLVTLGDQADE